MRSCNLIFVALLLLASVSGCAPSQSSTLKPYPLPPAAQQAVEELTAKSDVLILGEIHGT
jgi:hypothetical protein